ncbi:hypothetical protein [Brevibacillus thermoruber]|uniref:hypothetical protein n=1 Tax=Brevibacillus thermoruber TaxID=33942 RepID=UPI00068EA903|nr:hypothetical protein [Brevibacillus thermoruber]
MSTTIFNQQLNEFSRKYLVKGNEHLIKDTRQFLFEYRNVINSISEQFLLFDGVSFKVYGENIPLAVLINTFGVKGVEELLEQEAIEFVLWTSLVTYLVDDIPGVLPLQSGGTFTTSVHADPEASIESGLKWMRNPLPRKTRRLLTRKVLKAYKLLPEKLSREAVVKIKRKFLKKINRKFPSKS